MNPMDIVSLSSKVRDALVYHAKVDVAGRTFLRAQRLRSEVKARFPGRDEHPHFSPMLRNTPRLKELISSHFLVGREANLHGKVAWVTSGAPVEPLKALLDARNELSNLMTYMDGKPGAEDLIADAMNNPELLKSLAATPAATDEAEGEE